MGTGSRSRRCALEVGSSTYATKRSGLCRPKPYPAAVDRQHVAFGQPPAGDLQLGPGQGAPPGGLWSSWPGAAAQRHQLSTTGPSWSRRASAHAKHRVRRHAREGGSSALQARKVVLAVASRRNGATTWWVRSRAAWARARRSHGMSSGPVLSRAPRVSAPRGIRPAGSRRPAGSLRAARISAAVQPGHAVLAPAHRQPSLSSRWTVSRGARPAGRDGNATAGTSTHISGNRHAA